MPLKTSQEHIQSLRRKVVGSAVIKGLTASEIAVRLEEDGLLNPDTEQPFSIRTINQDIAAIEEAWHDEMLTDISEHRARVLAEIRELKSSAWGIGKLTIVSRAIEQEVSLLGLNKLERMGVEVALANLFKGMPKEVSSQLRKLLTEKVADRKNKNDGPKQLRQLAPINKPKVERVARV